MTICVVVKHFNINARLRNRQIPAPRTIEPLAKITFDVHEIDFAVVGLP